jgi:metal-dependent HD superfamily phosphatase/phosphodiesterase
LTGAGEPGAERTQARKEQGVKSLDQEKRMNHATDRQTDRAAERTTEKAADKPAERAPGRSSGLSANGGSSSISVEQLKRDPEVQAFLQRANEFMRTLGYTEHGQRHAGLVGHIADNVLQRLNFPERVCQLGHIAGYLHDVGNCVHREHHAQSGALIAYQILARMGMATDECALVMNAIGNHEEERGTAITAVSAAVIIADKADVHRSRVQNPKMDEFDIHDRVNYAATRSFVRVRPDEKVIALELEIDTNYASVIEYFEIFLSRMTMMRQACDFLGCRFQLIINDARFT